MQQNKDLNQYLTGVTGLNPEKLSDFLFLKAKGSFRLNTLKADLEDIPKDFAAKAIPWCDQGYFSEQSVSTTVGHFLGLFYIQEAASMAAVEALDVGPNMNVLDLCAAPGSKTTQMAAKMGNTGLILANEPSEKRVKTLRFNLDRMGVINTCINMGSGESIQPKIEFDRILVDAPCSNLGQMASNPDAISNFSMAKVKTCTKTQKKLIDKAVQLLTPDAKMVYSTCTYTVEENEKMVDWAIKKHGLIPQKIDLPMNSSPPLMGYGGEEFDPQVARCIRVYPKLNCTEGFFMCLMTR